jgi:hypothetical protein
MDPPMVLPDSIPEVLLEFYLKDFGKEMTVKFIKE